MKTRNIILLALTALLAVSCHSWDDPAENAGMNSYGNKDLKESNVVQISDLLTKYKNEVTSENIKQITDACQIKGIVTSNDEGGNIYKNLYVVDGTGGLCLKIDKTSLYAEAADGQCVLVDLKGLWIGGYGLQPQIGGTPYTNNSGKLVIGNINRNTWAEHYKLIPDIEGLSAKPITTNDMSALDMDKDFGKVVTLVGIKMKKADGTTVFAPSASGSDNQKVAGQASPVFIRTSTFAKFAKMVMPTGQFNITGVITRYNSDWQILPRAIRDIQEYTGSETLDYKVDFTQPDPEGEGTAAKPFNVIAAANKCEEIGTTISKEKYYVKGYVMEDVTVSSYGNASFEIADTKMGGERFTAYQVAGSDGKKMTEGYKINKGDEVIIYGAMYNYGGYKAETDGKGAAYIVTINGKRTDDTSGGGGSEAVPEGDGTIDKPFNAAAANAEAAKLADKAVSEKQYYIKGKVAKIAKDANYGEGKYPKTANFYISEDGNDANTFYIYAAKYLGNADYSSGDVLKVGDEVIILGNITNYNGTYETAQGKNYLYSLNGKTN